MRLIVSSTTPKIDRSFHENIARAALPGFWFVITFVLAPWFSTTIDAAEDPIRKFVLLISDDLKASSLGCYGNATCQPHTLGS